jgi:hypothetical protein
MMIEKIISGGQTGASRAALDVAIKLGLTHGGWITSGRISDDGILPDRYCMKELSGRGYREQVRSNVRDSQGTLVLSHGAMWAHLDEIRRETVRQQHPFLHIDLRQQPDFSASRHINDWLLEYGIRVLFVSGAKASEDHAIYAKTVGILEAVFFLGLMEPDIAKPTGDSVTKGSRGSTASVPKTVENAVSQLEGLLSLRDRATIANLTEGELPSLYVSLGEYIRNNFRIPGDNQSLVESCRKRAGIQSLTDDDAVAFIIRCLWQSLSKSHRLRLVKS